MLWKNQSRKGLLSHLSLKKLLSDAQFWLELMTCSIERNLFVSRSQNGKSSSTTNSFISEVNEVVKILND